MKITQMAGSLFAVLAATCSLGCASTMAQTCTGSGPKMTLQVGAHRLSVPPNPLSIPPNTFQNGVAEFKVNVVEKGGYDVELGEVRIRQVLTKETATGPQICGTDLHFTEPEFTNDPDAGCVVVEIEGPGNDGDQICFDIIVDRVGVLDPRARVTDQNALLGSLAEIRVAIATIDELRIQDDGTRNTDPNSIYDEYLLDLFGVNEQEARAFLDAYPNME